MRLRPTKYSVLSIVFIGLAFFFMQSAKTVSNQTMPSVLSYYKSCLDSLKANNLQLEQEALTADSNHLRDLFDEGRICFKKIEFLVEY